GQVISVISYQLSVPTAKAGENENTLIEYFFIPLKGGGFKPNFSVNTGIIVAPLQSNHPVIMLISYISSIAIRK
ncbi:MAG: hypothetical protein SWX82_28055, partial [Cyanobacteriota bacterium]|nr:hypothetical protein [Cyanobacteriota bacterium]